MTTPTSKKLPTDRPAELVAFLAIAPAVYGWLVSVSCPHVLAIVLAFIAVVVPLVVSTLKDAYHVDAQLRGTAVAPPTPADPTNEHFGIDHHDEGTAAGG